MRVENSFIPVHGVGEHTERRLWRAGVTTWAAFDGTVVGETRAARIRAFIDEARSHLSRDDARYFGRVVPGAEHWRLFENFRSHTCYLDIETTGLHRQCRTTVVGIHRHGGETTTLVRGDDLGPHRLDEALEDAKLLVTFNGSQFDLPVLDREFDLQFDGPHIDLRYPCRRLGLSGGLAAVERALGVGRTLAAVDGRRAVRLWHRYRRGDARVLDTLVAYNREDTRNLVPVMEGIADRLHHHVFESALDDAP